MPHRSWMIVYWSKVETVCGNKGSLWKMQLRSASILLRAGLRTRDLPRLSQPWRSEARCEGEIGREERGDEEGLWQRFWELHLTPKVMFPFCLSFSTSDIRSVWRSDLLGVEVLPRVYLQRQLPWQIVFFSLCWHMQMLKYMTFLLMDSAHTKSHLQHRIFHRWLTGKLSFSIIPP